MTLMPHPRRVAAASVALVLAVAGLVSVPISAQAIPLDFTGNTALKQCITSAVPMNPMLTPTLADMQSLTTLECTSKHITNIAPLQYATNLTTLDLGDNDLVSIGAVSYLTKLTTLSLWNNKIVNLAPVHNLEHLSALDASSNRITDLAAVDDMASLHVLNLEGNFIDNLYPLSGLGLTQLSLSSQASSDLVGLSVVHDLPLVSVLLTGPAFGNLDFLAGSSTLTNLWAVNGSVSDLGSIATIPNLAALDLSDNRVTSLAGLANLKSLEYAYLPRNRVADTAGIAVLPKLSYLDLSDNLLDTAPAVAAMPKLQSLVIDGNHVVSLAPLAGSITLRALSATSNGLTSMAPLAGLPMLQNLDVSKNAIIDISAVAALPAIATFAATDQRITLADAQVSDTVSLPGIVDQIGVRIPLAVGQGTGSVSGDTASWFASGTTVLNWSKTFTIPPSVKATFSGSISQRIVDRPAPAVPAAPVVAAPVPTAVLPPAGPASFGAKLTVNVVGATKVGSKLTAKAVAPAAGAKLSYRWYGNGRAIPKATKATLKLSKALKKKRITVVVTASLPGFVTVSMTSNKTARIR